MTATSSRLAVHPERCNRCGRCIRACPKSLVRVTSGYVHIDSSQCVECMACADVCQTGAIVRRSIPVRPTASASLTPGDVPTVVVGSRAEAKALRKAAQDAQKNKEAAHKQQVRADRVSQSNAELRACAEADGTALWTLNDAAVVMTVLVVTLVAKELAMASGPVSVMPPQGQVVAHAVVLGAFYSAQLAALAFVSRRHGMTVWQAFGLGRLCRTWGHRMTSAALVVALFVATRLAGTLWLASAQAVGWSPPQRAELTAVFGAGGAGIALAVLMVVFAAPLVEEMLFRGILLRALGQRWGMWVAVLGSAAVFALSHVTAWVLVPTLVLGIALGWLAWTRESLWPAIALHVLYNGFVVFAAFWLVR